jgi:hypothetical protein
MAIDIYSPRVMIPALKETKKVRTFLRDTFFGQRRTYRTENIDIDQQEKGRRVAPFVNRWAPGKVVDRQGFTTSSVAPPCIAMKIPITAQDVSTRLMGETVYEDRAPEQRGMAILADDLATLLEMLARAEEMMARDAIFNVVGDASVVTANGDDVAMSFTFTRKAALQLGTLTGTDAWSHADSDPLAQIDSFCETYAEAVGMVVTDIILGGTAYRTFLANAKVKAQMVNTSLIQTGVIAPQGVPDGARLVGTLYGGALRLWTYHEWYDDPSNAGASTAMVPAKKVMLASNALRTEDALRRGPGPHRHGPRRDADAEGGGGAAEELDHPGSARAVPGAPLAPAAGADPEPLHDRAGRRLAAGRDGVLRSDRRGPGRLPQRRGVRPGPHDRCPGLRLEPVRLVAARQRRATGPAGRPGRVPHGVVLRVKASDLPELPVITERLTVDGKLGSVVFVDDKDGLLSIHLRWFES